MKNTVAPAKRPGPRPSKPRPHVEPTPGTPPTWTFLTNYSHVLLCIAQEPEIRMRDVAARVGITERGVQRIVADLEADGYLERIRSGRRNRYEIRDQRTLRHSIEQHVQLSSLLALVLGPPSRNHARAKTGAVGTMPSPIR